MRRADDIHTDVAIDAVLRRTVEAVAQCGVEQAHAVAFVVGHLVDITISVITRCGVCGDGELLAILVGIALFVLQTGLYDVEPPWCAPCRLVGYGIAINMVVSRLILIGTIDALAAAVDAGLGK